MAKTKQQLIVENNTQFPNNNTGFISPDKLRTFNVDMIDSMVDELSYGVYTASIAAESASFDARIDALEGLSGSISSSIGAISASVASVSASVLILNDYTSSANQQLAALEIFTGSLNGFTASVEAQFAIYDEEIYNLNVHSQSLNAYTASVNSKFSTLATTTGSLQTQINTLASATSSYAVSASVAAVDAAQQSQINQLTAFTGSVGSAATGSLFASASFTDDTITFTKGNGTTQELSGFVDTGSFGAFTSSVNTTTASLETSVGALNTFTQSQTNLNGTFATTGSNTFNGNQIISGTLDVSGTFTASLQEGYLYIGNASGRVTSVPTSSIVTQINTGSLVTTSSFNAYTASTDGRLTNIEATTASLNISVTNLNSATASLNTSVSNLNTTTASLNTSVANINSFTSSANQRLGSLEEKTGSYATTGSNYFVGNQLVSGSVSVTGSIFVQSGSLSGSVISNLTDVYTDNSPQVDYVVTIDSGSYAALVTSSATNDNTLYIVQGDFGYVLQGTFTSFTASVNTKFNNVQASTASLNTFTSSAAVRLTNLESTTASLNTSVANLNTFTSSANGRLTNLESATASLNISRTNLNSYTASATIRLNNIEITTASLNTSVTNLNTFTASASESLVTAIVTNVGSNYYVIDGVDQPKLSFVPGPTYRFDLSGIAGSHPFKFSTSPNGPTEYTTGVKSGSNFIQIEVGYNTASPLYYYCTNHSGMGNEINVLAIDELATTGSNTFNGNQNIVGTLTASLQEGYVWVGDSTGTTTTVATSSFGGGGGSTDTGSLLVTASAVASTITFTKGDATTFDVTVSGGTGTGFPFTGSAQISGSLGITGSISFEGENFYVSGSNSGSFISNITDTYTSSTPIKYITTLDSASYAALATGSTFAPDTLYVVSGALDIPGSDGILPFTGSITGSYTASLTDVGKVIEIGVGGDVRIPNVTFGRGDTITFFNNTTASISLKSSVTNTYIVGVNETITSASLLTRGLATALFSTGSTVILSGTVI